MSVAAFPTTSPRRSRAKLGFSILVGVLAILGAQQISASPSSGMGARPAANSGDAP